MKRLLGCFICIGLSAVLCVAQQENLMEHVQPHGWAKAENGLIMTWHSMSDDLSTGQLDISNDKGGLLLTLNLLRLVPEAAKVDIADVSAVPGGLIAAAVAYVSKKGSRIDRPASAVVIFDFSGRLVSFLALTPWRDALRLEIDSDSHIWTLNTIADGSDGGYMLSVYSPYGALLKELLSRKIFPDHANAVLGSSQTGFAAMGRSRDRIWFWLPGSTQLVIVQTSTGSPEIFKTGLPTSNSSLVPISFVMSDNVLVGSFRGSSNSRSFSYYGWTAKGARWEPMQPGTCAGGQLVGIDGQQQVFLAPRENKATAICKF